MFTNSIKERKKQRDREERKKQKETKQRKRGKKKKDAERKIETSSIEVNVKFSLPYLIFCYTLRLIIQ